MRTRARVDDNQKQIVDQLRQIYGLSVFITSMIGGGFGDFVIGWGGKNYIIELKDGKKMKSKKKLTEHETKFRLQWFGQHDVCENLDEILTVLGIRR